VILPAHYLETHSVWLRLVVSEALRANMTTGGRRILLMLDEFAALGYLPFIERLFGVLRDYRVQLWPVFQDLPQLKGLYKDRWETLLGMAGVVQSFRAGDMTTAKWISERSGTTTRLFANVGQNTGSGRGGASSGSSMGMSEKEGPVIKPEEMFGYSPLESVAYISGQIEPEKLYMPHFTKMKSIRNLALPNPYYVAPNDPGAL
jgi:type IV secretion system protein VirD4